MNAERLEAYQTNIGEFRRLRASKRFQAALTALDAAIAECPCDEAIPTLAAMREELEPLTRPAPFWKALLFGARP
jgi:hypothetical protein